MMDFNIDEQMQTYISGQELAQAILMVRRGGEEIYHNRWGYSNLEEKILIKENSIFRLMSMTKVVTAVAVLLLIEAGKLGLDDPIERYIPDLKGIQVAAPGQYEFCLENKLKMMKYLMTFNMEKVKRIAADRPFTVRDLLSHSSGLEQGMVGLLEMLKYKGKDRTQKARIHRYSTYVLDFQPGTATSYSPCAGYDILGYLVSVVSGVSLEEYMRENIFEPLEMTDTTFFLNEEQKSRLVTLYKRMDDKLVDVTNTNEDMWGILHMEEMAFEAGSGGMFSTASDYEHLAHMLLNNGVYKERQILKPETVALMQQEGARVHLEPELGMVWGLGVKIRQDPKKAASFATEGTYGWSGAFGTHFFVSPKDNLEAVFMTNRADLEGSGSYVSRRVEEMVFGNWAADAQQ